MNRCEFACRKTVKFSQVATIGLDEPAQAISEGDSSKSLLSRRAKNFSRKF